MYSTGQTKSSQQVAIPIRQYQGMERWIFLLMKVLATLLWAHCCEFFKSQHTMEVEKVGVIGFHMRETQLWYYQLRRAKGPTSWEEVQRRCFQRFGPPESSNSVGELVTLQQIGTIKIYQRQFQEKLVKGRIG